MKASSNSEQTENVGALNNLANIENRTPTGWSLIKQNSFSSVSSFYPRFFWATRHFSIVFIFMNVLRKYGNTTTFKMLWEYLEWKLIHSFSSIKNKKSIEHISLRKLLRKKVFPEIAQDNPIMAPLRKGR